MEQIEVIDLDRQLQLPEKWNKDPIVSKCKEEIQIEQKVLVGFIL